MIRAYKYKMKPNEAQKEFLSKCFGCARFVYNYALSERIKAYRNDKKSLSFFDLSASVRALKDQEEYSWLREVPAMTLNYSILNLNNAYNRFFKTKSGLPRYKSKKRCRNSAKFDPYTTKYDFTKFKVRIPKAGWITICYGRSFDPSSVKLNSTTISLDSCGNYWCTVSFEDGTLPEPKAKVRKEGSVGLDFGVSDFIVLSNGEKVPNMRFFEAEEKRIAKMQRCIDRKHRGSKDEQPSNRYVRYQKKLARVHKNIYNRRNDFLQKLSTDLIRRFDTICIEDLNIKGMMRNHNIANAVGSESWCEFTRMLDYKGEWYGVNILRAWRFDPTSQICSACGYRNPRTKDLSVREWICPNCGTHHDRDVNAAVNIMNAAINKYLMEKSPEVAGITDANGVDSENNSGMSSPGCDYASDETSMQSNMKRTTFNCNYHGAA